MEKKPKVTIDASSLLTFSGQQHLSGIGRTTLELIRTFEAMPDLPVDITLFAQRLSSSRLQKYGFQFPVRYLPIPRWNAFQWVRSKLPLVEMLTNYDLFHLPQNWAPVKNPNRTIITRHDLMCVAFPEDHFHADDKNFVQRSLNLCHKCLAIITCSENSKKDLVKYGDIDESKIHVCHWGYDREIFKELNSEACKNHLRTRFNINGNFFFSVSCDIGRKRTPFLVHNFLKLLERGLDDYFLVLIWRNPPDDVLKEISLNKFANNIKIIPWVSDYDLACFYNCTEALLFPSQYEGFGLPVLEAMACGAPVVTSNAASLPEVGGDAAIYISPQNDDSLYKEMEKIANKEYDRQLLKKKSLAQAATFSWEKCAMETLSVYQTYLDI